MLKALLKHHSAFLAWSGPQPASWPGLKNWRGHLTSARFYIRSEVTGSSSGEADESVVREDSLPALLVFTLTPLVNRGVGRGGVTAKIRVARFD